MVNVKVLQTNECNGHLDKQHVWGRGTYMEVVLDSDRYVIMEYVSQQAEEFRSAEMYYLLKKQDSPKWEAEEIKPCYPQSK